jgi:acyl carrier protein phosphodiesterase
MNFLAHLLLSGSSEQVLVGNFIADAVKGRQYLQYPPDVAKGIILHRKIDSFTDTHPVVLQSVARLRPVYRLYAGVIVDIFYDHFLAANWSSFASEAPSLPDFSAHSFHILHRYVHLMPEKSRLFMDYAQHHDIPAAYAQQATIGSVLKGMAARTQFESRMGEAAQDLVKHYHDFEQEFSTFFPQIQGFAAIELKLLNR